MLDNISLSQEQKQVILGGLLGDAYYNKQNKFIRFSQCKKQKEYLKWKYNIFYNQSTSKIYERIYKEGYVNFSFELNMSSHCKTILDEYLRRYLYTNEGRKKISLKYLSDLDALGLAIWWMDDGSLCNSKGNRWGKLCTECFNYEEHILLQKYFKSKWGIDVKITNEKNKYYFINFNAHALRKLIAIIYPYVAEIPTMFYKIDLDYKRNIDLGDFKETYEIIQQIKSTF